MCVRVSNDNFNTFELEDLFSFNLNFQLSNYSEDSRWLTIAIIQDKVSPYSLYVEEMRRGKKIFYSI